MRLLKPAKRALINLTRPPERVETRSYLSVLSRSPPSTYEEEYALGVSLLAALLSDGFEEPLELTSTYSCLSFFLISSAPYLPDKRIDPNAGPMRVVPCTAATAKPITKQFGYTSPV